MVALPRVAGARGASEAIEQRAGAATTETRMQLDDFTLAFASRFKYAYAAHERFAINLALHAHATFAFEQRQTKARGAIHLRVVFKALPTAKDVDEAFRRRDVVPLDVVVNDARTMHAQGPSDASIGINTKRLVHLDNVGLI